MNKVTIDLAVADTLEIVGLSVREHREVYFDATENWEGKFEVWVYNSRAKNDEANVSQAVAVDENDPKRLIWFLKPDEQSITDGKHYIEIFNTDIKLIEYRADLILEK